MNLNTMTLNTARLTSSTASAGMSIVAIILMAIIFTVCVSMYFLPTIIGASRKVVNVGSVFAINFLLGWTLIGWVVALAMALRTNPSNANLIINQQFGHPGTTPPGWYRDPYNQAPLRYFDGNVWTDHIRS